MAGASPSPGTSPAQLQGDRRRSGDAGHTRPPGPCPRAPGGRPSLRRPLSLQVPRSAPPSEREGALARGGGQGPAAAHGVGPEGAPARGRGCLPLPPAPLGRTRVAGQEGGARAPASGPVFTQRGRGGGDPAFLPALGVPPGRAQREAAGETRTWGDGHPAGVPAAHPGGRGQGSSARPGGSFPGAPALSRPGPASPARCPRPGRAPYRSTPPSGTWGTWAWRRRARWARPGEQDGGAGLGGSRPVRAFQGTWDPAS